MVHIFVDSDDSKHGGGIDALTQSFVIKADIPAGNGDFQLFTSFSDSVNNLRELPHDVRLFGISEVQTVRGSDRNCAAAGYVTSSFGDGMHGSEAGIEV